MVIILCLLNFLSLITIVSKYLPSFQFFIMDNDDGPTPAPLDRLDYLGANCGQKDTFVAINSWAICRI